MCYKSVRLIVNTKILDENNAMPLHDNAVRNEKTHRYRKGSNKYVRIQNHTLTQVIFVVIQSLHIRK